MPTNRPDETTFTATARGLAYGTIIKPGDIATFTYDKRVTPLGTDPKASPRALPVHPTISRIRTDTTWDQVVRDFIASPTISNDLNGE